jgi:hypothetical protein
MRSSSRTDSDQSEPSERRPLDGSDDGIRGRFSREVFRIAFLEHNRVRAVRRVVLPTEVRMSTLWETKSSRIFLSS